VDLVGAYEDRNLAIADAPAADVLRELMRSNGLSQNKLAEQVGIVQPTISAVLNGRRSFTRNQVIKLAEFFNVDPAEFLSGRKIGNN
jgi:antitoxin component HigA of HigAB toxin-antitoxin module